ncbi:DUF1376 domain-containing protein [Sphingomonas aliaeris]|uniref:DUF1376 domain-containing protein n=1 Tax=Sphingomonas aliaeris TaxID=2759526 RepID=A0A974NTA0_9SPHN|nr:DUF1376 domain-containing protein [Sphingomonas aliaeris]QQV76515.1 DUF1376 domain-containing protein [Sphingomonas aliaeris]
MADFPALPLWTDAYLGDTMHLDVTEHGAYLLLLISAWRSPDTQLPDDDVRLARYARCSIKQWKRVRIVLAPFFEIEGGYWTQARLSKEKEYVAKRSAKAQANGKAGGIANSLKNKDRGQATLVANGEQTDSKPASEIGSERVPPIPTPTSVSNDTGAAAPEIDPVKLLFDTASALLKDAGSNDKQSRSIVGKWRRQFGDEKAMSAVLAAKSRGVSEPIEWITKRLNTLQEPENEARQISHARAERYRQMDMPGPPAEQLKAEPV